MPSRYKSTSRGMEQNQAGSWVRYEDYEDMRARAEKAEAEHREMREEITALHHCLEEVQNTRDATIEALMDVVEQACWCGNVYDSMAIGTYADALRFLATMGRVRITHDQGRRVIAERVDQPQPGGER